MSGVAIPQDSPNVNNSDAAFPEQSHKDGDYDPQPASHFGEVQIEDVRMNDEFAAIQQAFGGTEKGKRMSRFSFQNNAGGFDQYQQQSLQS
ncbi:hypothetical protein LTR95_008493 [Oleoguttula sp. CCFEE 5521]